MKWERWTICNPPPRVKPILLRYKSGNVGVFDSFANQSDLERFNLTFGAEESYFPFTHWMVIKNPED